MNTFNRNYIYIIKALEQTIDKKNIFNCINWEGKFCQFILFYCFFYFMKHDPGLFLTGYVSSSVHLLFLVTV